MVRRRPSGGGDLARLVAICVILLIDVFAGEKRRGLTPTLTLLALAVGAALTVRYAHVERPTLLFDGMYIADELGFALKLAGFLIVAVALLYSRAYLENRSIQRGEYYVLALTALLGIFVLVSANSLLTVYLGVELLALSVYAHGGLRPRLGRQRGSGHEVLRAGRHRLRRAALRHVAHLRAHRHARARRDRRAAARAAERRGGPRA